MDTLANGNLWISCSIYGCRFPTIESLTSPWAWLLQQLNSMNLTKLYVRSSCGRIYSQLLLYIILTTTRATQLLMMHFMEQAYHSFKIGLRRRNHASEIRNTTRNFKEGYTDTPWSVHKFGPRDIAEERSHHLSYGVYADKWRSTCQICYCRWKEVADRCISACERSSPECWWSNRMGCISC